MFKFSSSSSVSSLMPWWSFYKRVIFLRTSTFLASAVMRLSLIKIDQKGKTEPAFLICHLTFLQSCLKGNYCLNSKKKVFIRASKSARKVALFASYFVERFWQHVWHEIFPGVYLIRKLLMFLCISRGRLFPRPLRAYRMIAGGLTHFTPVPPFCIKLFLQFTIYHPHTKGKVSRNENKVRCMSCPEPIL